MGILSFLRKGKQEEEREEYLEGIIFAKPFEENSKVLLELDNFLKTVTDTNLRDRIQTDIKLIKYGHIGESNVSFELKHSTEPIMIFHDLRIEFEGYIAQIDFLILTGNTAYILETKRLSGDILITSNGNFIRNIKNAQGQIIKQEGMYSPITQAERQCEVLKKLLVDKVGLMGFDFIPLVIIANPKSIIKFENGSNLKEYNIIKHDQILNYIKTIESENQDREKLTLADLEYIKEQILNYNKPISYINKYKSNVDEKEQLLNCNKPISHTNKYKSSADEEENIRKRLKEYRLLESKSRNFKPWFIYSNAEMEELIRLKPKSLDELRSIKGFGDFKVENYGKGILEAFKKR